MDQEWIGNLFKEFGQEDADARPRTTYKSTQRSARKEYPLSARKTTKREEDFKKVPDFDKHLGN